MDRVEALAAALIDAATTGGRVRPVPGPAACTTVAALEDHMIASATRAQESGRSLSDFLRTLLWAAGPLADRTELDLDTVAALCAVAATGTAPELPDGWRTAAYHWPGEVTYTEWRDLMLSQLADLADLADAGPLDKYAGLGTRIPRPPDAVRATGDMWYNLYPASYLDCGLGAPEVFPADTTSLTWEHLFDMSDAGQSYE